MVWIFVEWVAATKTVPRTVSLSVPLPISVWLDEVARAAEASDVDFLRTAGRALPAAPATLCLSHTVFLYSLPTQSPYAVTKKVPRTVSWSVDALTDIRLLISSAMGDTPPLKVILVGQEPLRHTLRQSSQAALLSRIGVRHHLSPLSKLQTAAYIDFQLKQAGGSEKVFEDATKGMIHDYSGGIPRQINNLATACLLAASAENVARVTEAILQKTLTEFQLP